MECVGCLSCIKPGKKGKPSHFNLQKLVLNLDVVGKVFPHLRSPGAFGPNSVVCRCCSGYLHSQTVSHNGSRKRKVPPQETTEGEGVEPPSKRPYIESDLQRLNYYLNLHQYEAFITYALRNCPVFRGHMINGVMGELNKEMNTCPESLRKDVTMDSIQQHSWQKTSHEVHAEHPVLAKALDAIFPNAEDVAKKDKSRELDDVEREMTRKKGVVCAMAFHARNPYTHRFFQAIVGLAMWRQGATERTISTLQKMGLCQSSTSVRKHVDKISKHHADALLRWKDSIVNGVPLPEQSTSYSLCWDNVEIDTEAKHQGVNSNQHLMWGLTFAASNRVNTNTLDNTTVKEACSLPPSTFVISRDELGEIRDEMVCAVSSILKSNLPCLRKVDIPKRLHEHYEEMQQKSDIVSLGVVDSNPATTPGTIEIMEHMAKFIPDEQDVNCGGDGMSYERMINALFGRLNDENPWKLAHLKPTPQEFHKEVLLMQDAWNEFFTGESAKARGTIYQLKQAFRHRSLKKNVMGNFNHSKDMLKFATHSYVTLLAMELEGMDEIHQTPASLPDTQQAKAKWLTSISTQIVDVLWNAPSQSDLRALDAVLRIPAKDIDPKVDDLDTLQIYPYCCGEFKEGHVMVQCSSAECNTEWVHLSCAGLEEAPDGDFYCSPQCETSTTWIGCFCHKKRNTPTVECAAGDNCKRQLYYHRDCTRFNGNFAEWYCSEECKGGPEAIDHVYEHSMCLLWTGLKYLSNRRAVREGNGPLTSLFWKLDLHEFHAKNHYKYLTIAHHFLADIGGFLTPRMQADMLWNRVANVQGREGGNIGLDMVNEFLNKDFKGIMKTNCGQYHPESVQRASKVGGAFGKKVDQLLEDADVLSEKRAYRHEKDNKYQKEVVAFTQNYQDANLLKFRAGRSHKGLEGMERKRKLPNIVALGHKLQKKSEKKDELRELTNLLRFGAE